MPLSTGTSPVSVPEVLRGLVAQKQRIIYCLESFLFSASILFFFMSSLSTKGSDLFTKQALSRLGLGKLGIHVLPSTANQPAESLYPQEYPSREDTRSTAASSFHKRGEVLYPGGVNKGAAAAGTRAGSTVGGTRVGSTVGGGSLCVFICK